MARVIPLKASERNRRRLKRSPDQIKNTGRYGIWIRYPNPYVLSPEDRIALYRTHRPMLVAFGELPLDEAFLFQGFGVEFRVLWRWLHWVFPDNLMHKLSISYDRETYHCEALIFNLGPCGKEEKQRRREYYAVGRFHHGVRETSFPCLAEERGYISEWVYDADPVTDDKGDESLAKEDFLPAREGGGP